MSNYNNFMKLDNTFYLISRIKEFSTSFIEKELRKNNINGIATSHGSIIYFLSTKNETSMSDIANEIKKEKSTVTTLVGKLEKLGYVSLKKSEEDSRSTLVSLTEKGKELVPIFSEISLHLFETSKSNISDNEWDIFKNVLIKLQSNLSKK